MRVFGVALALVCISSACLSVIPSGADTDVLPEERVCTGTPPEGEDSECIGIIATSCDCNNGGTMIAVNAASVATIEQRRLENAGGLCSDVISTDETCCANGASCIDGRCELVGPRGRSLQIDCTNPIDSAPE